MPKGVKGVKAARHDLIPGHPIHMLAQVYGYGTQKYADRNWEMGYEWGKSYAALQRHLVSFWAGEELDEESGLPHLAHAMWHMATLMEFARNDLGTDDRSKLVAKLDSTLLNPQEIEDAKPASPHFDPFKQKGISPNQTAPQDPRKYTVYNDDKPSESDSWGKVSEIRVAPS